MQSGEIVESAKSLLSIEYVSVVGLLLCINAYFIFTIKKLKEENKEKDTAIMGFIQKYYVISTEVKQLSTTVAERLEKLVDNLNRN
jgi:hypothetical protein